jgi:hypothetical protein
MKVHLIGLLLCGLLIAAPTGVFAASNNYNNSRSNSAGVAVKGGAGNQNTKSIDSRFGGVNKDLKTAKPGGGSREPGAVSYNASKSNTSNIAVTGSGPPPAALGQASGKRQHSF